MSIKRKVWESMPEFFKELYHRLSLDYRKLAVGARFWVSTQEAEEFLREKRLFFVMSLGRSGTKWLATILSRDRGALVYHEPFNELMAYLRAYSGNEDIEQYIRGFRMKEIYLRVRGRNFKVYGEVNSYLRLYCPAIKKYLPNAVLIHNVRDGRAFIRSVYTRGGMRDGSFRLKYVGKGIAELATWLPREQRERLRNWVRLPYFERLCWLWRIENEFIERCVGKEPVRFEDMLRDYNYFKHRILEPLGIDVSKDTWFEMTRKRINVSRMYLLPPWEKWDKGMKRIFDEICGDLMRRYGYYTE